MGVPCLKGLGVGATERHWANGHEVYARISDIQTVVIYDTIDDYRREMSQFKEEEEKKKKPRSFLASVRSSR